MIFWLIDWSLQAIKGLSSCKIFGVLGVNGSSSVSFKFKENYGLTAETLNLFDSGLLSNFILIGLILLPIGLDIFKVLTANGDCSSLRAVT